jgi:aminoglycoside 3'-phosphotransferase-2
MPSSTIIPEPAGILLLPHVWHQRLAGCRIEAQAIGASRADVFRAHGGDGPDVFLKREPADDPFGELQDEVARLRWLQGQGVEAAQVLDTHDDASGRWLLMGAVPGRDLASSPDLAPLQVVHDGAHHALQVQSLPEHAGTALAVALREASAPPS